MHFKKYVIILCLLGIANLYAQMAPLLKDVKIAFVSYRSGSAEIYMMNSDGSEVEQITNSQEDNRFPVQIDKRTLGFSRMDKERKFTKYQIDIYTKEEKLLEENPVLPGAKWEAKSPDGRYIAFIRSTDYRDRELFLYDLKLKKEKQITKKEDSGTSAYSINHSWSPDGKRLVFMSGPDWYNQYIRIYNLEDDTIQTVTKRGYMNSGLVWLKDSKNLIANLKIRDKTLYELYHVAIATGAVTPLTANINLHPNISPDGNWIVFESQRHKNDGEVYIMRPDGSDQIRLTFNDSYNGRCIWFRL